MLPITFQAATAYLLNDLDLDGSDIMLEASIPVSTETGLTGREARLPTGDTLRLALTYTAVLEGYAITMLRNGLQLLTTQRVLCPLLPAMFGPGGTPVVTTSFYALMGDGQTPEIKTHAELPFSRPAFPLLIGRLREPPDPSHISGSVATVTFQFIEDDIWYVTPPAYTPPAALAAANGTRPLFPFRPNWASAPHSGGAGVQVERRAIGQGRQESSAYYEQPSRRPVKQAFTLVGAEAWQMLRLLLDWQANRQNFWLPGSLAEAGLTSDLVPASFVLPVDLPLSRGNNFFVLLDDDTTRVPLEITGTSGNNWTLAGTVGTTFLAIHTRIETLFLARLATGSIKLSFADLDVANISIDFVEVPWEVDTLGDETIGTTHGPQTTQAYLYTFSIVYPGATQYYRFTNYERDLTNGASTWTHAAMEHGDIKESAMLERQEVSIASRYFAGNPMALLTPFRLEWPLNVSIIECDVAGGAATNLRTVFSGQIESTLPDGPFLRSSAKSLASVFDRKLPRLRVQTECNLTLFEPLCGLDPDLWKWQSSVVSYNSGTYELLLNSISRVTGSAVVLAAHYFANGYLRFGSGAGVQYRWIADSTAEAAGQLALSLAFGFAVAPTASATIYIHPGCDGRYATCVDKFSNRSKFMGFPFMPVGNPSMLKVSKNVSSGGKK